MRKKATSTNPAELEDLYDFSRYPLKTSPNNHQKYREAYGKSFPADYSDLDIEMWCAGERLSKEDGGLGEFGHYKVMMQIAYPFLQDEWSHWLEMQLSLFCGECGTHTMLAGGGIGKSWFLGTFPRLWQACKPYKRGVMIINTTQKSQTERAWKYVIDCCNAFPYLPGKLSLSKKEPCLTIFKEIPNPKNPNEIIKAFIPGVGIVSQTVKKGSVAVASADLKGMHPDEFIVIVEEANHLGKQALNRARANWITNKYYQIVLVGNPEIEDIEAGEESGGDDSLYEFSTPVHGWETVEWGKTRMWDNKYGGKSLHFDPFDSPKIHAPNKFKLSTWLPDLEYLEKKSKELGGKGSSLFKQQIRGIYDHESLPYNPITLGMLHRFNCYKKAEFTGYERQRWAAFDPAYSGRDEAFLKIAESGLTESGRVEIDFLGEATNFSFTIDTESGEEASFQMLNWIRPILAEWRIPFRNFIMDANLIGIGIGDILSVYLSKHINKVTLQGQATDRILDIAGKKKANELCKNKASELWIAFQQLVITNQVRGIDDSIATQLKDMTAENKDGKIKVLEKKKFRIKYGYSPDRAECCLYIVDLIRDRGLKQMVEENPVVDAVPVDGNISHLRAEDVFINKGPIPYGQGMGPRVGMNSFLTSGQPTIMHNLFKELGWDKK